MKINIPAHLREFEERQEFRKSVGPIGSIPELRRLRVLLKREREEQFERFCYDDADGVALRRKVEARVLAHRRKLRNDPTWVPTGMLSGGGMVFESRVRKCMLILYKRRQERRRGTF